MPIYEYQCAACGQVTEKWQKFSEAPLTTCPHCGGVLIKQISCCAFHLKGSGWYVSDYGGGRPASGGSEATEAGADGAGTSGAEAGKTPETPKTDAGGTSPSSEIK